MKIKSISEIKVTKKAPNGEEYGFIITGDNVNIQLISASATSYGKHNEPLLRQTYFPYQVLVNDVEISIDGEFKKEQVAIPLALDARWFTGHITLMKETKKILKYGELRHKIHKILDDFFCREMKCVGDNEYDFEWQEKCVDDILELIIQQNSNANTYKRTDKNESNIPK